LRIGYVTFLETQKMKKFFALMLVVTAMVISGCAKSEKPAATPAPEEKKMEETTPATPPAEPAAGETK
jgi:PBP1b-binding outer membrane lipoprotein LpoB